MNRVLVLDHERRFLSCRAPSCRRHQTREIQVKGGPSADLTVGKDIALALLDDPEYRRQPQARSLAHLFGRKKWLEQMR